MKEKFKRVWNIPGYIELTLTERERFKLAIKLGQFTSNFCLDRNSHKLKDREKLKEEIQFLDNEEVGEMFIKEMIHPKYEKQYLAAANNVGMERFEYDLGFLIKGRIPFAYTKWYLEDHDHAPAKFDYDTVKKIWEKYI